MVVIDLGGFSGFGSRPIAVPLDAMVLLGQDMEVVSFTPEELRRFPTFSPSGTTPVADDAIIKVGSSKTLALTFARRDYSRVVIEIRPSDTRGL
jgi:hypothetical protein